MTARLFMFSCIASAALHALDPTQEPLPPAESMEDLLQQVDPEVLRTLQKFRDKNCPVKDKKLELLHKNACC